MVLIFKPDTLLRWHRELVRRKWIFNNQPKQVGRPSTESHILELVLQLARENRRGDDRITGELKKLGYRISHETVRKILRRHGILPAPQRKTSSTWRTFVDHYRATLLACDFFTVETIRLQTLYVFFFIEVGTRRVHQALKLFIHPCAPRANAYAERWVRSVREECLDRLIILNAAHLKYVLHEYEGFFNTARPHQGIGQKIPDPPPEGSISGTIKRRDLLGGVLHDYYRAA